MELENVSSHQIILQQLKDIVNEGESIIEYTPYVCVDPYRLTIYNPEILYSLEPVCKNCLPKVNQHYPFTYIPQDGVIWPKYVMCTCCKYFLNITLATQAINIGFNYFTENIYSPVNLLHKHYMSKLLNVTRNNKDIEILLNFILPDIPIELIF